MGTSGILDDAVRETAEWSKALRGFGMVRNSSKLWAWETTLSIWYSFGSSTNWLVTVSAIIRFSFLKCFRLATKTITQGTYYNIVKRLQKLIL